MKTLIKKMIAGTFLEPLAHRVYAFIMPMPLSQLYNVQAFEIMKRTLEEDTCCVDVGCHQGLFLQEMLRLAPKGTHLAFEPIPGMFQALEAKYGKYPNVHLHDCALSDNAGTATFQHVVSNPGYSGLRRRSYERPDEDVEEIIVKTNLLDKLVPNHITVKFIKVDVEGAELQVFKGAKETIKKCQPIIVFEHGLGGSDHYGTRPDDIYGLLVDYCDLRLFLMGDWLKSKGELP